MPGASHPTTLAPHDSPYELSNTKSVPPIAERDRLVYACSAPGNWEICLVKGSQDPILLTDRPAIDTQPRLNRGGTRVVFSSRAKGSLSALAVLICL